MKIKIDEIGRRIVIELDPAQYCLQKCDDPFLGDYQLSHRIDMSYKGKAYQEGSPLIYLTKEEADKLSTLVDTLY